MSRASLTSAVAACLLVAAAGGCDDRQALHAPEPGLERMLEQPRADPYGSSKAFADGRSVRSPPPGTVPRGRAHVGDLLASSGRDANGDAARVPIPTTRALLERGRARFDEVCATCHGVLGDGVSVVSEKMERRRPPSLFEPRIVAQAPGRVFRTISQGFGLMPGYAAMLPIDERWAIVSYLDALRLSQSVPASELLPTAHAELVRQAP